MTTLSMRYTQSGNPGTARSSLMPDCPWERSRRYSEGRLPGRERPDLGGGDERRRGVAGQRLAADVDAGEPAGHRDVRQLVRRLAEGEAVLAERPAVLDPAQLHGD